jgi:hypothetical protein
LACWLLTDAKHAVALDARNHLRDLRLRFREDLLQRADRDVQSGCLERADIGIAHDPLRKLAGCGTAIGRPLAGRAEQLQHRRLARRGYVLVETVSRRNGDAYKRQNPSSFSNHSWGTAIDLFFGAAAVPQGAQKTARGCLQLAPFFNKHGWYWGAGFSGRSVDSMHFELAEETILASAKALPARTAAAAAPPAAAVQASTFAGLDLAHFPGAPVMAKYRSAGFEITAVYASGGSERGSAVCALPRVFAGAVAARLFGGVFGARASTGFFAARFAMVASR